MSCCGDNLHCVKCRCGNITTRGKLLEDTSNDSEEVIALKHNSITIGDYSMTHLENIDAGRCHIHCLICNSSLYLVQSRNGVTGKIKKSRRCSDYRFNSTSRQMLPQCFRSLIVRSQSKPEFEPDLFDYNHDRSAQDEEDSDDMMDQDEDDFNLMFSNNGPIFVGSLVENSMLATEISV